MKKNILLLSILFFNFFSAFSQLHLDFENQPFSTQSWTENGTNWAITSGWANIRNYNGTAHSGTYSVDEPDNIDFTLENSADFNLNSLWLTWDNMSSDATSFTFTAYDVNNIQVGSPVVVSTSTLSDGLYHNITLNFNGIRKFTFHPDGTFSSMGTCFVDDLDYSLNSLLAVSWLNFSAQVKKSSVDLDWAIAQQLTSQTFTVQHSVNGSSWENLSVIKADGNSNSTSTKNYNYLHTNPANGINYYRILESDLSGTQSYSMVKLANVNSKNPVFVIKGNPVSNGLLTVEVNEPASLALYTSGGVLIWNKQFAGGTHTINVSNCKGEYLLKANATTQKVIIK